MADVIAADAAAVAAMAEIAVATETVAAAEIAATVADEIAMIAARVAAATEIVAQHQPRPEIGTEPSSVIGSRSAKPRQTFPTTSRSAPRAIRMRT